MRKCKEMGNAGSPPASFCVPIAGLRAWPTNFRSVALNKGFIHCPNLLANVRAQAQPPGGLEPATQFSSLANAFGRRLLVGAAAASAVALGGNLGGITSFLLGFEPDTSRKLKLDVVYPVNGYKRCFDTVNGFGRWVYFNV